MCTQSNVQARIEMILSSDNTGKIDGPGAQNEDIGDSGKRKMEADGKIPIDKPGAENEDISSEIKLLTPKLEGGDLGKRKREADGKVPRKVTSTLWMNQELVTVPFSADFIWLVELWSGCPWTSRTATMATAICT